MDQPAPLHLSGITKRFGATAALRGVDLHVHAGEVLGVVGENGAGKSTVMKIISGAHKPDAGTMSLRGRPYLPAGPLQARRAGVAMIYQELSLAPHLSIEQNVVLGVEPVRGPLVRRGEVRRIARRAMEQVGLVGLSPATPAGQLSPAQQQLVEIARAVAGECRVLVLDEPASSLGAFEIERLFALIRRLKHHGLAIIYISHFLEEISAICDRFTVLRDGLCVGGGPVTGTTHHQIISLMVGREVSELYPRTGRVPGDVVLSLGNLAGRVGPQDATLQVRRGEVVGIAGLMGAGRTELLRAIFGLDAIKRGDVRIGAFSGAATPAQRWRQGVGFVSEDRKGQGLALGMSLADNITLPRLRGLGPVRLVVPWRQARASRRWIDRLAIRSRSPAQRVGALSGGNQQKVALARLLHADVDVLLLDEPTRGIDVASKAQVYRLIDELAGGGQAADESEGRQRAILIASSYLPELLGICDRIAVMCRGRLSKARPASEWTEHRLMSVATGALAL